jgi:ubiquinone biosynthesis protein
MSLFIRLVRALWAFGVIFASYMVHLGLAKVFRRFERGENGREEEVWPAWLEKRKERIDVANARRLLGTMIELRGVYIKLGQVLSIMGGFLPRAYTTELESLQDSVPPHSFDELEKVFIRTLGKRPDECFASIDREPLAAASLGQVHVAYLADGTKLAVKILYPNIRDVIRVDMRVLGLAIRVYKYFFPFGGIEKVHASLVDLLRRETEYLHEANCMDRMAKNFADEPGVLFPKPLRELSSSDVLTMTFMEGVKITRFDELERLGISRTAVATKLVQAFYRMVFLDRFFHADPHPGNFLVQAGDSPDEPKIVILDFGAISEVQPVLIDGLMDILQGLILQDSDTAIAGFRRMGFISETGNKALVEATALLYFQKLLKIEDRTAGALMRAKQSELQSLADPEIERRQIRELMKSLEYPDGWFYVERASVMMFWLSGQLDPDLDTMQVGMPFVMPLIMKRQAELSAAQ